MNALQAVSIPAAVQDSAACFADPQLRHRNHFVELTHPTLGRSVVESTGVVLGRTLAQPPPPRDAPTMGGNDAVLRTLLGYSDERIIELVALGALQ